jgi:aspartyl-tRNA(Asn)/glutamyl-tRNA(Gln) amidotransferase subunit A
MTASTEAQALADRGVAGLAQAVGRGEIDPGAVANAFCARLEERNPSLNAVVAYDRTAVLGEATLIRERLAAGEQLPLAGVPVTIKDNLWVAGRRIAQGSRLFEDFIAPRDAWAVQRLRAAGALLLGITNTPEFACRGVCESPLHGVTRHPESAHLTPGGSSGGAAAAVAAGIGLAALATDAGGSIRRPAAHCGVVGLKPSAGVVPHPWGFAEPNYGFSVVGVIARNIADCEAVFRELTAYDAADPSAPPLELDLFADAGVDPRQLRLAWSPDLGCGFPVDPEVLARFERVIDRLGNAGFRVERADPDWPQGTGIYPLLALQQAGLHRLYGDAQGVRRAAIDPDILDAITQGSGHDRAGWLTLLRRLEAIRGALGRFFDRHDLLLCPTAPVIAWPVGGTPTVTAAGALGARAHAAFTPLFNYCGVPALSLPAGRVRGLPVGLQLVGPRFEDARVIRLATAVESLVRES